jgi:Gpi18-like mannosyltransferase
MIEHYPNNANWNEIINFIEEFEMKKLIDELDTHFTNIKLNSDKYIFGNDIFDYIEMYNVEKLYLHDKVKKDFQDKIIQKDLVPNINFKIININKISTNDSSDTLLKDYSGFLAIKYY